MKKKNLRKVFVACLDLYADLVGNHERGIFFFHFCAKRFQTFLHTPIEHLAILLAAAWSSASDDAYLLNFLISLVESIDSASKAAGLYYPYIFLNDAGIGQSPFPLYGDGESLPRMKVVAQKYDPDGVFQHLASGAFKL